MRLHFNARQIKAQLEHSKNAKEHKETFENPESKAPGLWLVGDEGVYFMSNGVGQRPDVAYAHEANANKMEYDDFRWAKEQACGGDDGVDYIPADLIENWLKTAKRNKLYIDMTPDSFEFPQVVQA